MVSTFVGSLIVIVSAVTILGLVALALFPSAASRRRKRYRQFWKTVEGQNYVEHDDFRYWPGVGIVEYARRGTHWSLDVLTEECATDWALDMKSRIKKFK